MHFFLQGRGMVVRGRGYGTSTLCFPGPGCIYYLHVWRSSKNRDPTLELWSLSCLWPWTLELGKVIVKILWTAFFEPMQPKLIELMLPNFFESWYSQYNNIRHAIIKKKKKMSECLTRHWKFILKIHSGLHFLTSWWNKFKIHITNIKQVNTVHKLPRSMSMNITITEFLPRPSFCFVCASYYHVGICH